MEEDEESLLFESLERPPSFKRRPVVVNGVPVDTLVPVLGASNDVWQLTPAPPPGRYLLQITPNNALDPDLKLSQSCFHAVIAA